MDSGNLSTKTLIIDAGINDSQFEEKTLALCNNLLTQFNHTICDKSWFEGNGPPELKFTTVENNINAIKKSLESQYLIFLIGDTNDIRFWRIRKIVTEKIKADSYPILFSLPVGSGNIPKSISRYEFWIKDIEMDYIPTLIRDVVAWESFPNFVGCDWTDIISAIGGQACRMIVYETDTIESKDDYQNFLLRYESLLKRARGIFMLDSMDQKVGDPMEMLVKLTEPLSKLLNDDCEIALSDCVYTTLPVKIRIALLIGK